jgi:predicted transcriptional regulator
MNKITIPTKIKIAMLKRGVRQVDIAEKFGVRRWAVSMIISGATYSRRIRMEICRATGLPWSIWEKMDNDRKKAA